ncbi:RNA polymerase sigma factor [Ochrovirga pacifica]|uniref:RNA polymerase sigma factor n=1 Tax=Ochrovirga pacifica TaxID=1042376 RepID=UPI00025597EF|nr:sigma-70 family RNA polymerase sigma factor [Ochrovirga pacifica]
MDLQQLIKKCQKNNAKAQATLYKLYAGKLFAVCCKYSKNNTEAEDNLHDGFITIFNKIHQFQHQGSFEGWMKRIMIHTALEKYRKDKVFPLVNEEIETSIPETIDEGELNLSQLLESIQKLPSRYRLVFNLYVLDGYSHKEIAKLLSISEGTSKSNLSRAKAILKKELSNMTPTNTNKTALL